MEASDYDYYFPIKMEPNKTDKPMEKTAKITKTNFLSEWTSPQGTKVFYHEIELSNGDKGQIGAKEKYPSKLNSGQELTYTIEETGRGNKIKAVVNNAFKGGRPQVEPRVQMISFAAAYTKDLVVAGKFSMNEFEKEFNRIYNIMTAKI